MEAADDLQRRRVLGVDLTDASIGEASRLLERLSRRADRRPGAVYFVHGHALNLACESSAFREVLNGAEVVFCDSAGAYLAARLAKHRLKAIVRGNDLLPLLFHAARDKSTRFFLLGAKPGISCRAAIRLRAAFPGVTIVGNHHGYIQGEETTEVLRRIDELAPDILLVGMGAPFQEFWIATHLEHLRVPLVIGVGGFFDYWGGHLRRAPAWMRRSGLEWLAILVQQPYKWRRYILGNPKLLYRALTQISWTGRLAPCSRETSRYAPLTRELARNLGDTRSQKIRETLSTKFRE